VQEREGRRAGSRRIEGEAVREGNLRLNLSREHLGACVSFAEPRPGACPRADPQSGVMVELPLRHHGRGEVRGQGVLSCVTSDV
jgi:hypothetical protein